MILPYVYLLTNKETKEFYIGYRCKNVSLGLKSTDDLGKKYFTSSKYVKPVFYKFDTLILAEFFSASHAYEFEQELIKQNIRNPLCLNGHYQSDTTRKFVLTGSKHTEEAKNKMRKPHGKINRNAPGHAAWNKGLTKETDIRIMQMSINRSIAGNGHQNGKKLKESTRKKIREKLQGRVVPDVEKERMSIAKKGKTWEQIYGVEGAAKKRLAAKENSGKHNSLSKPVNTPQGVFASVTEARKYFNVAEATIRSRCISKKVKWENWYYK